VKLMRSNASVDGSGVLALITRPFQSRQEHGIAVRSGRPDGVEVAFDVDAVEVVAHLIGIGAIEEKRIAGHDEVAGAVQTEKVHVEGVGPVEKPFKDRNQIQREIAAIAEHFLRQRPGVAAQGKIKQWDFIRTNLGNENHSCNQK